MKKGVPAMLGVSRRRWLRTAGISMVELAVVLGAGSLVSMLAWGLLAQQQSFDANAGGESVVSAETVHHAMLGFWSQRKRLPCPDTNGDGAEDCGAVNAGALPWSSLGLARTHAGWSYRVDSSLDVATARYNPMLPSAPPAYDVPSGYDAAVINELDACVRLEDAIRYPGAGAPVIAGARVAYVVTREVAGRVVERPRSAMELALSAGCPQRVAAARTAERAAHGNYDDDRVSALFLQYRDFAYQVRQTNLTFANVAVAIAAVDLANAVATGAGSIAVAVNSAGSAAGSIAGAVLAITFAGLSVGAAVYNQVTATEKRDIAQEQLVAASMWRVEAGQRRRAAYERAILADHTGGRL